MAAPMLKILPRHFIKIQCSCGKGSILNATKKCKPISLSTGANKFSQQSRSDVPSATQSNASPKGQKISQAMKAYLARAKSFDKMMSEEISEYEIGKRHLANIMGVDPESFTQEDIDKAIVYFFPSSLSDKKARPLLKHPRDSIPAGKAAMFSADGRPFHCLFYTGQQNYYQFMFEAGLKLDQLKALQDKSSAYSGTQERIFTAGSKWINFNTLKTLVTKDEGISETDYNRLIRLLQRLTEQPNSKLEEDFIFKFRDVLTQRSLIDEIQPERVDSNGRVFQSTQGTRKSAKAELTLYRRGTGKFTVNGQDILIQFPRMEDRQQLLFPLQFTGLLGDVDVVATVEAGGCSSQAGAIRLALSRAVQTFVHVSTVEKMRLVGLLTPDPRKRERKKFGQEKARKKFTWKKR